MTRGHCPKVVNVTGVCNVLSKHFQNFSRHLILLTPLSEKRATSASLTARLELSGWFFSFLFFLFGGYSSFGQKSRDFPALSSGILRFGFYRTILGAVISVTGSSSLTWPLLSLSRGSSAGLWPTRIFLATDDVCISKHVTSPVTEERRAVQGCARFLTFWVGWQSTLLT